MQNRSVTPLGGLYDHWIRFAKLALPILAVGLLLLLIILPLLATQEFSFLLDKNRVAVSRERLQLVKPVYQGTDRQGRRFVLEARRAVQRSSADPTVELQGLHATLQSTDGVATLDAPVGDYNLKTEVLTVGGSLRVSRADGYRFETRQAVVNLKTRMATSTGGVSGETPIGRFTAAALSVNVDTGAVILSGGTHVHVTGRG